MGGSQGGNGGWIETSGHTLNVNGINVNTSAPRGTTGTWLLDPNYFEIVAGNVSSFASSLNGTDIIISSNNTGSNSAGASGDINFGSDVVLDNSTSTHKLTLNASRNINLGLNAGINLPLGFVVLSPNLNVGSDQPSGTGVVRMLNGSRINANTLTVGGNGIVIESATATSTAIAAIIATNTFSVSGLSGGIGLNTLNLTGKLFDVGIANSTMNVNVALQNSSSVLGFSNSDNPVSVSGVISGPGALVKSGTQILTINSQNSFSGGLSIDNGILSISNDNNLGASTGGIAFNIGNSPVLQINGNVGSNRNITTGNTGTGFATIDVQSNYLFNLNGGITGVGNLQKKGNGTLSLNSSSNYSGGTTLSAGTILVKSNSALGAVTGSVTFAGGTLELAVSDSEGGATGSTPSSRPSVLQSGTNSTLLIDPGVVHENSAITSGTGGLTIINNGLFTKSGKFSEASSITVKGSGVTTFSGINTYTGPTNIIGGNLALAGSGSITNSPLSISNGVFSIRNASAGVTIKSLSGSGIFDVGTTALTITGASSGYTGSFIYGSGSVLATATTPTATTTARVSETQTAQIQQILATSIPRVNIVVPPPPPPPPPPQASVVSVASPPPPPPTSSAPVPPPSSASNAPVPPPSSSASNVPPPPPSSSASNVPGPTNAPPPPPTLVSANLAPPPVVNVSPTFTATSVPSAGPTSTAAAPTSPVAETPPPPQLTSAAVPLDTPAPKDSGTKSSSIKDDGGKKDDGAKDDGSKQSGSNLILAKTSGSADGGSKEPAPTRKATIVRNVPVTNGVVVQTSSRARIENINPMTRSFGLH
jgi:autotransporter-associated beta strand protein